MLNYKIYYINVVSNWKRKHLTSVKMLELTWSLANDSGTEQSEIRSAWSIRCSTYPQDGNMLLPGVIWSNRGYIVVVWFHHANQYGKKGEENRTAQVPHCENMACTRCLLNSACTKNCLAISLIDYFKIAATVNTGSQCRITSL